MFLEQAITGAYADAPTAAIAAGQRAFFFRVDGAIALPLQKSMICLDVSACSDVTCRFAAALAWPRAEPITLLAELSQTLMNGFFVVQGLRMKFPESTNMAVASQHALRVDRCVVPRESD